MSPVIVIFVDGCAIAGCGIVAPHSHKARQPLGLGKQTLAVRLFLRLAPLCAGSFIFTGISMDTRASSSRGLTERTETPLNDPRNDKDSPLAEDIRFLGRLLGDVLREQEGDIVFDVVETIRQSAVKFRRENTAEASQALERKLQSLSPEQTVSVVRAFSHFSHLANIAEDRHHNRRRRIHELAGSIAHPGTIAYALERMRKGAHATPELLENFFSDALIVPVLTAHPTEVSRKCILDAQHDIARLLAERDQQLTARERARNESALRARVTSLWQTRMLRDTRLSVAD